VCKKHRSVFDPKKLKIELEEVEKRLQSPDVWSDQNLASSLGQQSREIKGKLTLLSSWQSTLDDIETAIELEDE